MNEAVCAEPLAALDAGSPICYIRCQLARRDERARWAGL